jgi:hypothetical protein
MRVDDAEPETVPHNRHVQGHAPHTAPMQNSGVGGKGGGILQFKCEDPGGGTPHVSQFNYQRSKPDANNHNIWMSRANGIGKNDAQFRFSKSGFDRRENHARADI